MITRISHSIRFLVGMTAFVALVGCVSTAENTDEMPSEMVGDETPADAGELATDDQPAADLAQETDATTPVPEDAVETPALELGAPLEGAPAEEAATEPGESAAVTQDDTSSYKLDDTPEPTVEEPAPALDLAEQSAPAAMPVEQEAPVLGESAAAEVATVPAQDLPTSSPSAALSGDALVYMVGKGDSLSLIAKKFYGGLRNWKALAKANKISKPNRIEVGRVISIPINADNQAAIEAFVQTHQKSVTVRRGDTLAKIAQRVLGTKLGWKYLWKANLNVISNPHRIEVGQSLQYLSRGDHNIVKKRGRKNSEAH